MGLEPIRPKTLDPKSNAATNYATCACFQLQSYTFPDKTQNKTVRVSRQAPSLENWILPWCWDQGESGGECMYLYASPSLRSSSIFIADTGIRVPGPKIAATPAL